MADKQLWQVTPVANDVKNDDGVIIGGQTAGTRYAPLTLIANFVHNLWASFVNALTAKTSFASGDKIPVVNGGTATAMEASKLLELTATNALVGKMAPEFVPNSTNAVAGMPYVYGDKLYVARVDYNGAWDESKFIKVSEARIFDIIEKSAKVEFMTCWVSGSNIALASYNTGDVVDLTPDSVDTYQHIIVNVKEGDRVVITATGGANPRAYGILDADNHLLAKADAGATLSDYVLDMPANASKLIVNSLLTVKATCFKGSYTGDAKARRSNDIVQGLEQITEDYSWTYGKAVSFGYASMGDTIDVAGSSVSGYQFVVVDVEEGDRLNLACNAAGNYGCFAFLDKDKKLILKNTAAGVLKGVFTAPIGSKFLVVNNNYNSSAHMYGSVARKGVGTNVTLNDVVIEEQFYNYDNWNNGYAINFGSVDVGGTVDLTPSASSSYQSIVADVSKGDVVIVSAKGGSNPRVYGFIDSNNKLVAKADASLQVTNLRIFVPENAAKIIVNNTDFSGKRLVVKKYIDESYASDMTISDIVRVGEYKKETSWVSGKNINVNKAVGSIVNLTPETVVSYEYLIADVEEGDSVYLTAKGGSNPRAYAFLDADNRLLEKSADTATLADARITAPARAKKLVVNNQRSYTSRSVIIQGASASVSPAYVENSVDCSDPLTKFGDVGKSYRDCVAIASGAKYPILSHSVINDTVTEKACHVASFVAIGSVVYYAYYCNYIHATEEVLEQTARFGVAGLDGTVSSIVDVVSVGDTVLGYEVTALSDIVVLKEDEESDELHLLVTLCINSKWCVIHYLYTISTATLGSPSECGFSGNGINGVFDCDGVNAVLSSLGLPTARNYTIQVMPKISARTEGNDVYYYTGIGIVERCFVARTKDFENWEYVSTPTFDYTPRFEPATIIRGDYLYWFCRQDDAEPSCVLSRYNLVSRLWDKPVFVGDCQSRPDFFVAGSNELFLIHAPMNRNFLCVEKINETYNCKSYAYKLFYAEQTFYPFIQVVGGEVYCVATYARREIRLFKVPMDVVSNSSFISAVGRLFS